MHLSQAHLVGIPKLWLRHHEDGVGHPVAPRSKGTVRSHPRAPHKDVVPAWLWKLRMATPGDDMLSGGSS